MLALCLALSACAHRRPDPARPVVRSIRFEGNGGPLQGTTDYQLRAAMEQEESRGPRLLRWVRPRSFRRTLDRDELVVDAWRIETWYAHHGYFDARFLGWDVQTVRPGTARRPPSVVVVGHVEEGPASLVRSVSWEGMEAVGGPLLSLIDRERPLQDGARFDLEALEETEDLALERLRERSFAYATLDAHVSAVPEERAVDVHFVADLGPSCSFGAVTVRGLDRIPQAFVEDEIDVEEGDPFRASVLARAKSNLFGLGTFSVVNVVPELQADRSTVVPVSVDLAESRFRQIKLGGGLELESGKTSVHASSSFQHVNIANRLYRLDVRGLVGWTSLVSINEIVSDPLSGEPAPESQVLRRSAPVAEVDLDLAMPRVPVPGYRLVTSGTLKLGIEEGYRFFKPEVGPTVIRAFNREISAGVGYRIRYNLLFDVQDSLIGLDDPRANLESDNPYVLSWLTQFLTYDSRDNVLFTRSGSLVNLELREAGGPLQGRYTYLQPMADLRTYRPVRRLFGWTPRGTTVAARAGGGLIVPYGSDEQANVHYSDQLYLGGTASVRGWTRNHLGPYVCGEPSAGQDEACGWPPAGGEQPADVETYPIGGRVALQGGVEVRNYWVNGFGSAVFLDAGMVWSEPRLVRLGEIKPSVGAGLRYKTPIGPARIDLAMRLDDDPLFAAEPRFTVHFNLSEAY